MKTYRFLAGLFVSFNPDDSVVNFWRDSIKQSERLLYNPLTRYKMPAETLLKWVPFHTSVSITNSRTAKRYF